MSTRDERPLLGDILDAVGSALLLLTPDGTPVLANSAAERLLGRPREELLERPLQDTFEFHETPGHPLPAARLPWIRAARGQAVASTHGHLRRSDGSMLPVFAAAHPLVGNDTAGGAMLVLTEGTTTDRLVRSARLVLDQLPVAAMVTDATGRIRYANARFVEFWGRPAPEGRPEDWVERFPMWDAGGEFLKPEDRAAVRALKGELIQEMLVTVEREDAVRELALVSAAPLTDEDGCVVGSLGFITDVTEREMDRRLSSALTEITALLDSAAEPDEVLPQAMEAASLAIGATAALLLERTGEGWRVAGGYGFVNRDVGRTFDGDELPVANEAEETGKPVAVADVPADYPSAVAYFSHGHPVRAVLAIPLDARGVRGNVLELIFSLPTPFTPAHIEFAERLSRAVSLALANATLVRSLRDELGHSTLLQEVAVVAASSPDLRVVCTRVLKALARHLGMKAGDIRIASPDGKTLRLVAHHGYPEEMVRLIEEVPARDGVAVPQLSFASGKVVTDQADRDSPERAALVQTGAHAKVRYISMPIDYRKRRIGVISLAFPGLRSFTDEEVGLIHAIAHTVGQAVEAARLLDAEKEARRQATAELEVSNLLLGAAERLSRPLELQGVCDALAEVLEQLTGRSRVVVTLHRQRENRMVVMACRNVVRTWRGESSSLDDVPPAFMDRLLSGRPQVVYPAAAPLPPDQRERALETDALVALMVPLRVHDRLLGFATLDEPGVDTPFTEREIRLTESVASQAAVLIDNARVYEAEHRIAQTLQETLLLMPDRVPGVRFGTLYRSATAAARVGGDFYDLFETGDGKVSLVVGDVSGKGLDAASVTALARNAVRIHGHEGLPPSEVMQRTNEVIRRFTSPETFVTAFFGQLDTRTGTLTYVSAGHPEAMIVGEGGYVRTLAGESPLLGALEDVEFVEGVTMVAPTDTVFIYTDGVTEARRGRELFGTERLAEFLGGLRDNEPDTLPQSVFAAIEAFSEGRLRDDVAIMAVRRDVSRENA